MHQSTLESEPHLSTEGVVSFEHAMNFVETNGLSSSEVIYSSSGSAMKHSDNNMHRLSLKSSQNPGIYNSPFQMADQQSQHQPRRFTEFKQKGSDFRKIGLFQPEMCHE